MSSLAVGARAHGLVSVVVAAYNASRTIARTIESVLAQSHPAIEVVMVDDGSTDGTAAAIEPFRERVRVVSQPNRGLPAARNAGCAAANGELIALMDADDLCHRDRIAIEAAILGRHPQAVACSSDFAAFDDNGPIATSHAAAYYSAMGDAPRGLDSLYAAREALALAPGTWPALGERLELDVRIGDIYRDLAFGNFVHPPTVMLRKSVLACAGPADETLKYTSDWEWLVRMARCGPFAYVQRSLLDYRISQHQMSTPRASGGQVAVDVVRAATKIWAADPALAAAQPERVRRCTRDFCFDAAYAMAERRKGLAARMLARSLWNGGHSLAHLKTAARIAMPSSLVQLARRRAAA